jgi:hypothetical protein
MSATKSHDVLSLTTLSIRINVSNVVTRLIQGLLQSGWVDVLLKAECVLLGRPKRMCSLRTS